MSVMLTLKNVLFFFENNLEFKQLSDGEYQLLSVYALIDLFDDEKTIFLFDEIDSHLYYKNLEKLWGILSSQIKGKIITTTHISDSILQNKYSNIKLIQKGKIENDFTLKELAKRLSSIIGKEKFEYELAALALNVALLDDEVDFIIFKKLVQKKMGNESLVFLDKIIPFKRESNYDNPNIQLGKSKLLFAQEFIKKFKDSDIQTRNLFLICDKDKFSTELISNDLSVSISDDFKDVKEHREIKTHLLCWKRNEIENYLLSYSMLEHVGKLGDLITALNGIPLERGNNFDNIMEVARLETKDLLHPLYKPKGIGFDESLLDKLIELIPANEISKDIETMYNVLKQNIK